MTSEEHKVHSASTSHSRSAQQGTSRKATNRELSANNLSRKNAGEHYAAKRRKSRRGIILRGALIGLVVLLFAGAGVAWAYINSLDQKLGKGVSDELRATLTERVEPSEPFYMLLLGVDKGEERTEEYGDEYWNYRADTIILARIDPKAVKVTLVSIPRDTYVDMHENGQTKINAAYSFGGASYMVQIVEEFSGVKISHYAEIDFDGFVKVVDGVGGIDVNLPVAISDPEYTGIELDAGEHHLDGWDALMLARSRHAYDEYGGGDFYRAANQRMVISAVARKVLSSDIVTMSSTISTLADYVTTDMSATDIISLAIQMHALDIDHNFYSGQTPTISSFFDELWYEVPDDEAWAAMMARVDAGEAPYTNADDDFTAGIAGTISNDTTEKEVTVPSILEGVEAEFSGSVTVLNAAAIDGLATETADKLNQAGFSATADTANSINGRTVIFYNGDATLGKAKGIVETLGGDIDVEPNDGNYSTDVDLVLLLGTDNRF